MLHGKKGLGWFVLAMVVALFLTSPGAAQELKGPRMAVARLVAGPTRIDWLPQVDYERLVLTVAGPGDLYIQRGFSSGEAPFFSSLDGQGGRLPDGVYAYELRTVPRQDLKLHEKLAKAREAGDASAVKELETRESLTERSLVQSGHLWVQGGSFADKIPAPPPPSSPSGSASKPPTRTLGTKDYVVADDLIVQGQACIGSECVSGDANSGPILTLKELFGGQIKFQAMNCCVPYARVWALQANDVDSTNGDFLIRDVSANTIPFRIGSAVPDNAFTILYNANVGLGTLTPAVRLDVKTNASGAATERLQNSSSTGYSGTEYLNNSGTVGLFFGIDNAGSATRLNSTNSYPIVILTNSTERMRITSAGSVGIGTASPSTKLHVSGSAGTTKAMVEETSGTTTPREILELRNNGGSVLILEDTSVAQRWAAGTNNANLILDEQAHAGVEFSLTNVGNLTISGILTQGSSRDLKTNFASLDPKDVLTRVSALPVTLWSYKEENAVRHIGPMAEDFHQAFGLGTDDKHIAPGDQAGVALLAVQGLNQRVEEKAQEIEALRRKNADLEARIAALEALLTASKPRE